MNQVVNYALHLGLSTLLIFVFILLYTRITPHDEFLLVRQGNVAAACSFGGALVGFSLTVASCILHSSDYREFLNWAAGALVVQILAYAVATKLLKLSERHIQSNNVSAGILMGSVSLSVGAINAACIS